MREIKSYEDLIVYQRAFENAAEIHKITLGFPKIEQYALADQIRRASKSICANIAEGYARRVASVREFRRFLSIAFGSSEEMRVWINFARRLEYLDSKAAEKYLDEYVQIGKMLRALYKSWNKS